MNLLTFMKKKFTFKSIWKLAVAQSGYANDFTEVSNWRIRRTGYVARPIVVVPYRREIVPRVPYNQTMGKRQGVVKLLK